MFFSHFIYWYVAATSVLLLLLVRDRATLGRRLMRLVVIGLLALVLTAWIVVPLFTDADLIGPDRWEPRWKVDSFGRAES